MARGTTVLGRDDGIQHAAYRHIRVTGEFAMAVAVQLRLSRDLYATELSVIRPSNQGVMASRLAYSPDVSGTSDSPQASQEL